MAQLLPLAQSARVKRGNQMTLRHLRCDRGCFPSYLPRNAWTGRIHMTRMENKQVAEHRAVAVRDEGGDTKIGGRRLDLGKGDSDEVNQDCHNVLVRWIASAKVRRCKIAATWCLQTQGGGRWTEDTETFLIWQRRGAMWTLHCELALYRVCLIPDACWGEHPLPTWFASSI